MFHYLGGYFLHHFFTPILLDQFFTPIFLHQNFWFFTPKFLFFYAKHFSFLHHFLTANFGKNWCENWFKKLM